MRPSPRPRWRPQRGACARDGRRGLPAVRSPPWFAAAQPHDHFESGQTSKTVPQRLSNPRLTALAPATRLPLASGSAAESRGQWQSARLRHRLPGASRVPGPPGAAASSSARKRRHPPLPAWRPQRPRRRSRKSLVQQRRHEDVSSRARGAGRVPPVRLHGSRRRACCWCARLRAACLLRAASLDRSPTHTTPHSTGRHQPGEERGAADQQRGHRGVWRASLLCSRSSPRTAPRASYRCAAPCALRPAPYALPLIPAPPCRAQVLRGRGADSDAPSARARPSERVVLRYLEQHSAGSLDREAMAAFQAALEVWRSAAGRAPPRGCWPWACFAAAAAAARWLLEKLTPCPSAPSLAPPALPPLAQRGAAASEPRARERDRGAPHHSKRRRAPGGGGHCAAAGRRRSALARRGGKAASRRRRRGWRLLAQWRFVG